MNRLIQFLLFLMMSIGLLAGLSIAASISILFLLLLIKFRGKVQGALPEWIRHCEEDINPTKQSSELTYNFIAAQRDILLDCHGAQAPRNDEKNLLQDYSFVNPTILMLLWCVISCLWAPDFYLSLKALIGLLFFTIAASRLLSVYPKSLDEFYNISQKPLLYGLLSAITLFFIEYYSGGVISTTFKSLIQHKSIAFELPWLDRGVVFISLLSWFVIYNLFKQKQYMLALGIYISISYILYLSDSLAGFVGFILASAAYIALHLTKMRLGPLMRLCFALYIIAMPIMAYKQDPLEISNKYSIPDSAKHRLFIWNFVAYKITDHPIIGYGFSASKNIATENDIARYGQYEWCLLPLHPHNNVLQILLETGLVGFILFMLIVDNILKWTIRNNNALAAACLSIISLLAQSHLAYGKAGGSSRGALDGIDEKKKPGRS